MLSRSPRLPLAPLPPWLLGLLGLAGLAMLVLSAPGPFPEDEVRYLASALDLLHGEWPLPDRPWSQTIVPPIHALLAAPGLGLLGWRGAQLLNVLSFLACVGLAHAWVERRTGDARAARVAAAATGLGGFLLTYAIGLWPHLLATGLAFAGFLLAPARPLASGVLLGLATGCRYPSVLVAAGTGLGLFLLPSRRLYRAALFGCGLGLSLGLVSIMKTSAGEGWLPFAKGNTEGALQPGGYLQLEGPSSGSRMGEGLHVLATRVLDYRLRPPASDEQRERFSYLVPAESGAFVLDRRGIKKSMVQSAPWILLALLGLASSLRLHLTAEDRREDDLRSLLVVAVVLATHAAFGFRRVDGLCYNQRYLQDLLPFLACALARAVPSPVLQAGTSWTVGAGAGLALGALPMAWTPEASMRHHLLSWLPLALALAGCGLVHLGRLRSLAAGVLGGCLAWGLAVHALEDIPATHYVRERSVAFSNALLPHLTGGDSLVAVGVVATSLLPLTLAEDVRVINLGLGGVESPAVLTEQTRQGRRVVLVLNNLPAWLLKSYFRFGRIVQGPEVPVGGATGTLKLAIYHPRLGVT